MKLLLVLIGLSTVLGFAYSQECDGNEFYCEDIGICIPGKV
ncbi:Low-density lipoprotein receptor 2 [Orchesella cincta]|uniref:Low-density lipoprotein receptor 2 n=1 Tax=Orchesella cincta TaxID=48709 RepID=A0A1D2N6J2_ORCCI|nr:Low-density lipoprotein receptor 2 [Orchesella cincta]